MNSILELKDCEERYLFICCGICSRTIVILFKEGTCYLRSVDKNNNIVEDIYLQPNLFATTLCYGCNEKHYYENTTVYFRLRDLAVKSSLVYRIINDEIHDKLNVAIIDSRVVFIDRDKIRDQFSSSYDILTLRVEQVGDIHSEIYKCTLRDHIHDRFLLP